MTRMIERWFPCAEVSRATGAGWGHGKVEKTLFPWFAARPPAQAKAALICSLLKWPDDPKEQQTLQHTVVEAMTGRYGAWDKLVASISDANGEAGAAILDPFSGRGMIALEAARLGLPSFALDYSPLAVLASRGLADYPFRDWTLEPALPFASDRAEPSLLDDCPRLLRDVAAVLAEVGRRFERDMDAFYPRVGGRRPWAYVYAVTLPCQECSRRFPLFASNELRKPSSKRRRGANGSGVDPGQSFSLAVDRNDDNFWAVVHDGPPTSAPTLVNAHAPDGRKIAGKSAVCPFCSFIHPLAMHRRLTHDGCGTDELLVVADLDDEVGKRFRSPEPEEFEAVLEAAEVLRDEAPFAPGVPAVPNEGIAPGNNNIIGPSIYGVKTFGDYMPHRQTLAFVRLARAIKSLAGELSDAGVSADYTQALATYAGAVLARKVRRSGRAATLDVKVQAAHDIFSNQGSIGYSYDFIEVGIGSGQGTWDSIASSEVATLRNLMSGAPRGQAAEVVRGTATRLPSRSGSFAAVITDPPYDEMLAYADSSDVMYVWVKRALGELIPDVGATADPYGTQEKFDEIIVKRVRGEAPNEHRTREHYDTKIAEAFAEMRRAVSQGGVVTIVFGSGDPEVWQRLLTALKRADLVMTGSWPASTEAGSHQGKANIETTLTMACRPAPPGRQPGRKGAVEAEITAEVRRRYPDWERWGLAPADMLMAAAGPAMEIVGRYTEVLDSRGEPVGIHTFLPLARAAVQQAMAVEIDHRPLDSFDARTRFALWWARLYGRQAQAKSELRWQALASSIHLDAVRDLVEGDKGVALVTSTNFKAKVTSESAVIDVALCLAAASEQGLAAMGEVLAASQYEADDQFLWAAIHFLADRLPDADPDAVAFHRILRARAGIGTAAENVAEAVRAEQARQDVEDRQIKLL